MTATVQLSRNWLDQLRAGALAPHAGIYEGYLGDRGCVPSTKKRCLRRLVRLGWWMSQCGLDVADLDEEIVAQLLDGDLPHCRFPAPVGHTRADLRAEFGHLLVVLSATGAGWPAASLLRLGHSKSVRNRPWSTGGSASSGGRSGRRAGRRGDGPDDTTDLELGALLAATKRLPPDTKAGVLLWSCGRHGSMATAE